MCKKLPEELKQRGRFCLWKYEMRKGQQTKVPYRTSGEKADPGDSNTFTDFKSAQTAPLWKQIASVIPLISFFFMWVTFVILNTEGFVGIVTFFAIGVPFIAATKRWIDWFKAARKTAKEVS